MRKYPKKCPVCGSKKIRSNDAYGIICDNCGYNSLRKVPEGTGGFTYGTYGHSRSRG